MGQLREKRMKRPQVAITGCRGVLAAHLISVGRHCDWHFFQGDITDPADMLSWIKGLPQLDAAIHLAAVTSVRAVEENREAAFAANVVGVQNFLDGLRQTGQIGTTWFFFASSSHVYRSSDWPITETDPLAPISYYGETKYRAEKAIETYRQHGGPICIGRIFSYTSPFQSREFVIPSLSQKIRLCEPRGKVLVHGSNTVRDYLLADQVAGVILRLMQQRMDGVINIGSGQGTRIGEFAEEIRRQVGRADVELDMQTGPHNLLIADTAQLRQLNCQMKAELGQIVRSHFSSVPFVMEELPHG